MAFSVKVPWSVSYVVSFEQVFDNLSLKSKDAFEETDSVSRRICLELLFLDSCRLRQILTIIVRIKQLLESVLVCSDVNER